MSTYQHIDRKQLAIRIADGGDPADFIHLGLKLAWQERPEGDTRMTDMALHYLVDDATSDAAAIVKGREWVKRRAQQAQS